MEYSLSELLRSVKDVWVHCQERAADRVAMPCLHANLAHLICTLDDDGSGLFEIECGLVNSNTEDVPEQETYASWFMPRVQCVGEMSVGQELLCPLAHIGDMPHATAREDIAQVFVSQDGLLEANTTGLSICIPPDESKWALGVLLSPMLLSFTVKNLSWIMPGLVNWILANLFGVEHRRLVLGYVPLISVGSVRMDVLLPPRSYLLSVKRNAGQCQVPPHRRRDRYYCEFSVLSADAVVDEPTHNCIALCLDYASLRSLHFYLLSYWLLALLVSFSTGAWASGVPSVILALCTALVPPILIIGFRRLLDS